MSWMGVQASLTDRSITLCELVDALVERGFGGLWVPEHTHWPVTTDEGSYPGTVELTDRLSRLPDPLVTLAAASGAGGLELGTAVAIPAHHDPIALAKAVATLDWMSGGRVVLGVGFGWSREEFTNHRPGAFNHRRDVLEECVAVMRALWSQEVAAFEGQHVRLSKSSSWPKPVRDGRVPILLGAAASPRNFEAVARWADGWLTLIGEVGKHEFPDSVKSLREVWHEAERGDTPDVTVMEPVRDSDDMKAMLDRCREQGVTRVLLHVGEISRDSVLPILDRYAPEAKV